MYAITKGIDTTLLVPVIFSTSSKLPVFGLSLLFERWLRGPGCWYLYFLLQVKAITKFFIYKHLPSVPQRRDVKLSAALTLSCCVWSWFIQMSFHRGWTEWSNCSYNPKVWVLKVFFFSFFFFSFPLYVGKLQNLLSVHRKKCVNVPTSSEFHESSIH